MNIIGTMTQLCAPKKPSLATKPAAYQTFQSYMLHVNAKTRRKPERRNFQDEIPKM